MDIASLSFVGGESGHSSESPEVHALRSTAWATIVGPHAKTILALMVAIVVTPFVILLVTATIYLCTTAHVVAWLPESATPEDLLAAHRLRHEQFMGWAQLIVTWGGTVLAPVVGFTSAVLGYFFGASQHNG